jgi:hypothetical protein
VRVLELLCTKRSCEESVRIRSQARQVKVSGGKLVGEEEAEVGSAERSVGGGGIAAVSDMVFAGARESAWWVHRGI